LLTVLHRFRSRFLLRWFDIPDRIFQKVIRRLRVCSRQLCLLLLFHNNCRFLCIIRKIFFRLLTFFFDKFFRHRTHSDFPCLQNCNRFILDSHLITHEIQCGNLIIDWHRSDRYGGWLFFRLQWG
ncbi:hypothetical protein PENTCL1PPCAC_20550, partial [Pristionchus entomophagus]